MNTAEIREARAAALDAAADEMDTIGLRGATCLAVQRWLRQRARCERLGIKP